MMYAALVVTTMLLSLGGCDGMPTAAAQDEKPPVRLEIHPDAATGPDFLADGAIEHADEADYYELVLAQEFASVVVMTTGDTDTAGAVETAQRMTIATPCEGATVTAQPPCMISYDSDIATNPDRNSMFNAMPPSGNFLWEGKLGTGTFFIRVTGERGATGAYQLIVELNQGPGPVYSDDGGHDSDADR